MENFEVVFEPKVLQWAREKAEFSTEILRLKLNNFWKNITVNTIVSWENGTLIPTPTQVRKLAEIYKRPVAVFLLANPPEENILPPDRRTLGSKKTKNLSQETLFIIRKARRIQFLAEGLEEELSIKRVFAYQKYTVSQNPEKLAQKIREDFSISISNQFKFRRYSDFFEYLRSKIEDTGVITLRSGGHDSFPVADARAFSFVDRKPYVILINNKDTEGAKNFSLLHEFAHILIREESICNNFNSFNSDKQIDPIEVFCNKFAASFLVPHDDFIAHRILVRKTEITIEELDFTASALAKDFKVSRLVILRKLLSSGFVTPETYKNRAKKWGSEKPPHRLGGKNVPAKSAILKNGVSFSSLVIEAYKREKLSHATASDYLGTKTKYLSSISRILNSNGR